MKKPVLVLMAAGMGSRYGGLKQIDPIHKNGEIIMDYSVYDAKQSGFEKAIVIINRKIEKDFRTFASKSIEKMMDITYVFQDIHNIPQKFSIPEGRIRPWGTGHAVLSCIDEIDSPFCVINADDFYGREAFEAIYPALLKMDNGISKGSKANYAMVGYKLCNTLSPTGYVSRGVCTVDDNNILKDINEKTHIIASCDGPLYSLDSENYQKLSADSIVSMNLWGFGKSMAEYLQSAFPRFLYNLTKDNKLKAEFYLPQVVSDLINSDKAYVNVLPTDAVWHGVTYKQDKQDVCDFIDDMIAHNIYPDKLV